MRPGGLEPPTNCLRGNCSAIELWAHNPYYINPIYKSRGWLTRIEPATSASTERRSNRLSYSHHVFNHFTLTWLSAPSRIRTCDLLLRRQLLYPAELWAHGAGEGDRTPVFCLEGRCSTIELLPHNMFQSGCPVSNRGPLRPKRSTLPSELHPVVN